DEDAATKAAKIVTRPNRTDIESSLSTARCPSTANCGRGAWRIMSHPIPLRNRPQPLSTRAFIFDRRVAPPLKEENGILAASALASVQRTYGFHRCGGPQEGSPPRCVHQGPATRSRSPTKKNPVLPFTGGSVRETSIPLQRQHESPASR